MDELIRVQELKKYFKTAAGTLHAVDGVSFSIQKGQTLGVVGESGCGKSTLGRVILGLLEASGGQVLYGGSDITHAKGEERFRLRREMQMIFQDPFSSLDPRMSVSEIIAEPLIIYKQCAGRGELDHRVAEIMDTVGLASRLANSYPHELDGGRRQRIGIGRALALRPRFIVCDEPVSALDVSIQAQVLNLMKKIQKDLGLTYLFIAHDLSVVQYMSNRIVVMYLGKIVEIADSRTLYDEPLHPYTCALLSAIPVPQIRQEKKRIVLPGEVPSPIRKPTGCALHPRCPHCMEKCKQVDPVLSRYKDGEHLVACHLYGKED